MLSYLQYVSTALARSTRTGMQIMPVCDDTSACYQGKTVVLGACRLCREQQVFPQTTWPLLAGPTASVEFWDAEARGSLVDQLMMPGWATCFC